MQFPQLTFRELHYFMAVATQGSFSHASELLHISQPSLSMGIRSLENKLDVRLFERSRKTITLTEKGEILLRYAERLLQDEQNLYRAMTDETGPLKGTVKISLPPAIGSIYFRSIIREFCQLHPNVALNIEEHPSDMLETQLLGRHTNIVAIVPPVHDREIHIIPFAKEEMYLLMAQSHPLAQKTSCSFADITEERLILLSEDFKINKFINEAFARHGASPLITGRTSDITLLLAMVQTGVGLTIIPASLYTPTKDDGLCRKPLTDPTIYLSIALATRRNSALSKAEEAWLQTALHARPQQNLA